MVAPQHLSSALVAAVDISLEVCQQVYTDAISSPSLQAFEVTLKTS